MKYLIVDLKTFRAIPCGHYEDVAFYFRKEEQRMAKPADEHLGNIIFNSKLFNTSEKFAKLKQTLDSCITLSPEEDEKKVDANTKNQFFYLYAALWSLPDVITDKSMMDFIRQMNIWYPEWFPGDKKKLRNFEQSLSHEKKKWEKNEGLLKVTDWKKHISQSGMSRKKAEYFESLAMKIYTTVNHLVKEL